MAENEVNLELEPNDLAFKTPTVKRHIGAVYRSGFMPSHRTFHSYGFGDELTGSRFSRIGRGRQFV